MERTLKSKFIREGESKNFYLTNLLAVARLLESRGKKALPNVPADKVMILLHGVTLDLNERTITVPPIGTMEALNTDDWFDIYHSTKAIALYANNGIKMKFYKDELRALREHKYIA